jgi:hypothetical protein
MRRASTMGPRHWARLAPRLLIAVVLLYLAPLQAFGLTLAVGLSAGAARRPIADPTPVTEEEGS